MNAHSRTSQKLAKKWGIIDESITFGIITMYYTTIPETKPKLNLRKHKSKYQGVLPKVWTQTQCQQFN